MRSLVKICFELTFTLMAQPQSMVLKWTPFFTLFWAPSPAEPLRLALVDPTDKCSRVWKPVPPCSQFDHYACFPASSPSFSLFERPPSPSSWQREKANAKELPARAET